MANEKRLIDANELVDTIHRSDEVLHSTQWETDEIVDQIYRIPTIDAVEVVRCKDCEFSVWNDEYNEWECVRTAEFNDETGQWYGFSELVEEHHFCSYGERKDK
jgi:hypothetical protein